MWNLWRINLCEMTRSIDVLYVDFMSFPINVGPLGGFTSTMAFIGLKGMFFIFVAWPDWFQQEFWENHTFSHYPIEPAFVQFVSSRFSLKQKSSWGLPNVRWFENWSPKSHGLSSFPPSCAFKLQFVISVPLFRHTQIYHFCPRYSLVTLW